MIWFLDFRETKHLHSEPQIHFPKPQTNHGSFLHHTPNGHSVSGLRRRRFRGSWSLVEQCCWHEQFVPLKPWQDGHFGFEAEQEVESEIWRVCFAGSLQQLCLASAPSLATCDDLFVSSVSQLYRCAIQSLFCRDMQSALFCRCPLLD